MSDTDELAGVELDMSPELQESEQEVPVTESQEDAKPVEGAALATAEGEDPDKTTEAEGGKTETDGAQKAINKQYRLRKEAEETLERERQEKEQLAAQLREVQGLDKEPTIPPLPEQYEDGYEEKMAQRDQAIQARAAWQERQRVNAEHEVEQQRQAQIAADKEWTAQADKYAARAEELGVNGQALQQASAVVTQFGISDDLAMFLARDPEGPLLTQYLATDLPTLESLAKQHPLDAGAFIEREIRAKAQELRPKKSSAPKPPETLSGGGPGDDSLGRHKGVTIE